ncbi:unnamed protein product, partial [Urochloa humidicola]
MIWNEECFPQITFIPPTMHDVVNETLTDVLNKLETLTLPDCPSLLESQHPSTDPKHLFDLVVGDSSMPITSDVPADSAFSLDQLLALCSTKSKNTNESQLKTSPLEGICMESNQFKVGMSLNERAQVVLQNKSVNSHSQTHQTIDPSASFDLITSCFASSPTDCGNKKPASLSAANVSSTPIDSTVAQQYEDLALQAEANYQLKLVTSLANSFVTCSNMINQEPHSRILAPSVLEKQVIFATQVEKDFYVKFTSNIPTNLP